MRSASAKLAIIYRLQKILIVIIGSGGIGLAVAPRYASSDPMKIITLCKQGGCPAAQSAFMQPYALFELGVRSYER